MITKLLKTGKLLALGLAVLVFACNESTDLENDLIENYVDHSVFDLQSEGKIGKFGCVEFVFPITAVFPDDSEVEVGSYEDLRAEITAWKEANPDADKRPHLGLPLDVLTEDGEMITIETRTGLRRLRLKCARDFFDRHGHKGHGRRGQKCFKLTFPLSLVFPDGLSESFEDRASLKMALRTWKAENPDVDVRPMLAYPLTVELEDGTTQEIASQEELRTLKASCSD